VQDEEWHRHLWKHVKKGDQQLLHLSTETAKALD
jgi:hypothetical protein